LTNRRRGFVFWKMSVRRANGKRRMVWELRGKGERRRGRERRGVVGWMEIGGRRKWRRWGKKWKSHERREMIGGER
jgi:hypothetical protein